MPLEKISGEELVQEVEAKHSLVVEFGADWCAPCRRLEPELEELSNFPQFNDRVRFVQINLDEIDPSITNKYGVASVPTILLFRAGKIVARFGTVPKRVLLDNVQSAFA